MRMRAMTWAVCAMLAAMSVANAGVLDAIDWSQVTSHSAYQAVNSSGSMSGITMTYPLMMVGVVLNTPSEMLNVSASSAGMGGQWQIAIQAVQSGDFGGTCCWMGQNYAAYGMGPFSYGASEWNAEVARVGHNADTASWLSSVYSGASVSGATVEAGDLVVVYARNGMTYYNTKRNINEGHLTDAQYDFDVCVLQKNFGMPTAAELTLSDVVDASSNYLFDTTRATGCERYQDTWVTLNDVQVVGGTWGAGKTVTLGDATGRTFACLLGQNIGGTAPTGYVNVTGIFDQEKTGYRLWVMSEGDIVVAPEPMTLTMLAAIGGVVAMRRKKDRWIC